MSTNSKTKTRKDRFHGGKAWLAVAWTILVYAAGWNAVAKPPSFETLGGFFGGLVMLGLLAGLFWLANTSRLKARLKWNLFAAIAIILFLAALFAADAIKAAFAGLVSRDVILLGFGILLMTAFVAAVSLKRTPTWWVRYRQRRAARKAARDSAAEAND